MNFRLSTHWLAILTVALGFNSLGQELLPEVSNDSAATRWLNKKVIASRELDDMETPEHWTSFTTGAPKVVDARVDQKSAEANHSVAEMSFSRDRSREGRNSLHLRVPSRLDIPGPKNGRGWGSAGVRRAFLAEDWRSSNRISLWIYPDCVGFNVVSLELRLYNDGPEKLPAAFGQEGETTIVLHNQQWNQVVWEIGNVARDKVTAFEISILMSGHEPGGADFLNFDLDHLELQQVEPDYIEGWAVWPGRISYSHSGYQSGTTKSAIANNLQAKTFQLIDEVTGKAVLSKPIQTERAHLGEFQLMDFSEVHQPGRYHLQAGDSRTQSFPIGPDVWRETIFKALNFLYGERCGIAVPGVHDICHRDWICVHDDKRIIINGGWHDAGDLTQGLGNTGEIVYGLFSLAERLHAMDVDPELYQRVIEEARWGLDWVLKTSFGDGFRNQGAISSRWTDGILGTSDDLVSTARNSPIGNFTASAAEAIAARVLKDSDPRLAAYSLKMAEADWQFACQGMADTPSLSRSTGEGSRVRATPQSALPTPPSPGLWRGTFDSDSVEHETPSVGVLASVDLWEATGNQRYADKAVGLAKIILACQERKRHTDWAIPLLGFFYTSTNKDRISHYCHRGRDQAPVLALIRLCQAFPNHPDWMKWYSAVVLYSEYLKAIAKYTEPYGMMPASIYQADEYLTVPESRRDSFRKQVLNGIPLGSGYYLRLFPVWLDYRGNFGTILPQAQALLNAAHLRGDLESVTLAQHQAEWIVGRNPFSQSTMYGEGHDYPPLYAPFPGNLIGALPVGIQTHNDNDVPYWPVQSTWTYKEVWVHPVGRWIWLMRDLAGPALVEGKADAVVELFPLASNQKAVVSVHPVNGQFRATLAEGKYRVKCHGQEQTLVCLPASQYHLDLRPGRALDFEIATISHKGNEVRLRLTARGQGDHSFSVRSENLTVDDPRKEVSLKRGGAGILEWSGRIKSNETPWVLVVVPDENLENRKELIGAGTN